MTFLLIHHTGKNIANGMRGWSGVRAAIDTEIEVTISTDESGMHVAEVTEATRSRRARNPARLSSAPSGDWSQSLG